MSSGWVSGEFGREKGAFTVWEGEGCARSLGEQ